MSGILNMMVASSPRISSSFSPSDPISTESGTATNDTSVTITVTGGTVTSYLWTLSSGSGSVTAGSTTATATLRVTDSVQGDFTPEGGTFNCAYVVNGVTYNATIDKTHSWT